MKPSAGLIPVTGHFPRVGDRNDGRTVLGPLAASVGLAWSAVRVAGPDGADGGVAPVVLGDPDEVELSALRFAIGSPGGAAVSPVMEAALDQVAEIVKCAGASLVGEPPDWLAESRRITEAYWDRTQRTGRQVDEDLRDWDRFRWRMLMDTRDIDVIVTPTVGDTAPLHRAMETKDYMFASLPVLPAHPRSLCPSAMVRSRSSPTDGATMWQSPEQKRSRTLLPPIRDLVCSRTLKATP